jgi:hypothetical protein
MEKHSTYSHIYHKLLIMFCKKDCTAKDTIVNFIHYIMKYTLCNLVSFLILWIFQLETLLCCFCCSLKCLNISIVDGMTLESKPHDMKISPSLFHVIVPVCMRVHAHTHTRATYHKSTFTYKLEVEESDHSWWLTPTFTRRCNHCAVTMPQSHLARRWATMTTRTPIRPEWEYTVIWARKQALLLCNWLHLATSTHRVLHNSLCTHI